MQVALLVIAGLSEGDVVMIYNRRDGKLMEKRVYRIVCVCVCVGGGRNGADERGCGCREDPKGFAHGLFLILE